MINHQVEECILLLKRKGLTVGTAESCTGGMIAKLLTDLPGSSAVFKGGIVSYTDEVKHNVLGVPQAILDEYGAVSPHVADAMVRGAKRVLGCDIGLSSTGLAGPGSDDRGNPVGWVYLGIYTPKEIFVHTLRFDKDTSREQIRNLSAQYSIDLLWRYLNDLPLERYAERDHGKISRRFRTYRNIWMSGGISLHSGNEH